MTVKEKVYRWQIDREIKDLHSLRMANRPTKSRRTRSKEPPENFIAQWMVRRGKKAVQVAKAAGITESYLSLLLDNSKRNPGIAILLGISECLDCTVNDLFKPPPELNIEGKSVTVSPEVLKLLGNLKDALK